MRGIKDHVDDPEQQGQDGVGHKLRADGTTIPARTAKGKGKGKGISRAAQITTSAVLAVYRIGADSMKPARAHNR
ncbi:hypothetical protein [Hoeflea halophila]|uniref:hypothetical protein n=1 Tax=Hoeflea halophila TaxID=714899 RepID=UPI000BE3C59E|nr:hypothetical protein [Hoeflea halophila]